MLQIEECTFPTSNASVTIEKTFSYQSVGEDDRAILKLPTKKLQKRLYCAGKNNVTVSEKTANFSYFLSAEFTAIVSHFLAYRTQWRVFYERQIKASPIEVESYVYRVV